MNGRIDITAALQPRLYCNASDLAFDHAEPRSHPLLRVFALRMDIHQRVFPSRESAPSRTKLARCVVNLIAFDRISPACLKSDAPAPYTARWKSHTQTPPTIPYEGSPLSKFYANLRIVSGARESPPGGKPLPTHRCRGPGRRIEFTLAPPFGVPSHPCGWKRQSHRPIIWTGPKQGIWGLPASDPRNSRIRRKPFCEAFSSRRWCVLQCGQSHSRTDG